MAVTKKEFILATFVSSCISVGLLVGAFGTQNWVEGEGITGESRNNLLNYGLFQGTFTFRVLATSRSSNVYVTCLLGSNVCAVSCKTTAEARKKEVSVIHDGYSVFTNCDSNGESTENILTKEVVWMNGGVYVSTILFLAVALLMSTISAIFGLFNTTRSPVEPVLGIFGLYIWNGCAACCELLVLMIWGIHYATNISQNLSFTQIMISNGEYLGVISNLGFSYWLVFIAMFCNIINGILLAIRLYLIQKEPPPPMINIEKNADDTIFLY